MARILSPRIDFREFAAQYLVGYIITLVAGVVVGLAVAGAGASGGVTAIASNLAQALAWYIYVVLYYLAGGANLRQAVTNLVRDFGAAEALDLLLVRPGLLYIVPKFTHSQASGIVVATILADVVYTAIALNRQRRRTLG